MDSLNNNKGSVDEGFLACFKAHALAKVFADSTFADMLGEAFDLGFNAGLTASGKDNNVDITDIDAADDDPGEKFEYDDGPGLVSFDTDHIDDDDDYDVDDAIDDTFDDVLDDIAENSSFELNREKLLDISEFIEDTDDVETLPEPDDETLRLLDRITGKPISTSDEDDDNMDVDFKE